MIMQCARIGYNVCVARGIMEGILMREFDYTVKSIVGLHPRVAGVLMHLVRDFESDIILTNGDKGGNLKKLLGILHMNIQYGDRLHLQISGEDEEVACQEMQAFMAQNI